MRMVIPLSKSITPLVSLLNSPLGTCHKSNNSTNLLLLLCHSSEVGINLMELVLVTTGALATVVEVI